LRKFGIRRVLALGLALVAVGYPLAPGQAEANGVSCSEVRIPVTLAVLPLLPQTMFGRLCVPDGAATVQVLIPGGSYTSSYWDLPADRGLFSFRAAMNEAGYATLTVDRLGTGRSSKPLSVLLTTFTDAAVMHQVVGRLRSGALGHRFAKVIIGGHSLGASISVIEAANYQDVDGVLLAALTHHLDLVDSAADGLLSFYPATVDPLLAKRLPDPGYLTTEPGTRYQAFHNPGQPVAGAIDFDESTKDVFAATEAADAIGVSIMSPYSILINAPVLVTLGGQDELFCSPLPIATDCSSAEALRQQEAPFYNPNARLRTYLLPGSYGHSFNFAPNAAEFATAAARWADELVGR